MEMKWLLSPSPSRGRPPRRGSRARTGLATLLRVPSSLLCTTARACHAPATVVIVLMLSLLSRYQHDASAVRAHLALPALLLFSCTLAYIGTPLEHSLLQSGVAWLSICTYTTLRTGARSLVGAAPGRKLAWAAGALFALARVEERTAEHRGIWWAKVILPLRCGKCL